MKKTLSLIIIAIIALTSSINANAWTDRNTFNLKGPVKAVYNNGSNYASLSFYENGGIIFEEDADLYWATIDRDNKGRIIYMSREKYSYNSKGQVIKITGSGGGASYTTKYTYNAKGQVIKEICDGEITTYTYQAFDSYGNWTKRTAKTGRTRTVQTRTITYYE